MNFFDTLERYDVVWTTPSIDSAGSMPLGNGDIGINLWVNEKGEIHFYIGKTDAWAEMANLLKVGKIVVSLYDEEGNPIKIDSRGFYWRLHLGSAQIEICYNDISIFVIVDAKAPCIRFRWESPKPLRIEVAYDIWRKDARELLGDEKHSLHRNSPYPVVIYPDFSMEIDDSTIGWYHRNESSTWESCLKMQGLERAITEGNDPLINRTFGAIIFGDNLVRSRDNLLVSSRFSSEGNFCAVVHTAQTEHLNQWCDEIALLRRDLECSTWSKCFVQHEEWWKQFWEKSYLFIDGNEAARKVTEGYIINRFLYACSGRGRYPIKFNGSIFTADWKYPGIHSSVENSFNSDYRRWGPGYWHQNTRLPYWGMLCAGDFEMMLPFFQMYIDALPLAKIRTQQYFGHGGAYFPESMYFWGAYQEGHYGWSFERGNLPEGEIINEYLKWHLSSSLEVTYHMFLYFQFTKDDDFAKDYLVPFGEAVLEFYHSHYPLNSDGKMQIKPSQVIEQFWEAINPMPDLAGLWRCTEALLSLQEPLTCSDQRHRWEQLRESLPDLPVTRFEDGTLALSPAQEYVNDPKNHENPELYAVFPYQLYSLSRGDLMAAKNSFERKNNHLDSGWSHDSCHAALLGYMKEARDSVVQRVQQKTAYARFPGFYGPNFDWIPDVDHSAVTSFTTQMMLIQYEGRLIRLLPAWPKDWNCKFKLHAPFETIVEGQCVDGVLVELNVFPPEREKDVVVCAGQ